MEYIQTKFVRDKKKRNKSVAFIKFMMEKEEAPFDFSIAIKKNQNPSRQLDRIDASRTAGSCAAMSLRCSGARTDAPVARKVPSVMLLTIFVSFFFNSNFNSHY